MSSRLLLAACITSLTLVGCTAPSPASGTRTVAAADRAVDLIHKWIEHNTPALDVQLAAVDGSSYTVTFDGLVRRH